MKHITKITTALLLIFFLASCQSSKSGCYDFGSVDSEFKTEVKKSEDVNIKFTAIACKP